MHIEITSALQSALQAFSDAERDLIAIGKRTDPERKFDLVQHRRKFVEQMGLVSQMIDRDGALQRRPEMVMEMNSRLSAFRFAIGQHQASWPAVRIDDDAAAYAESARGTYAKADRFWDWCSENLTFERHSAIFPSS
ncbi:MAG: hypothetical protein J7498_07210 [Sphingobium sp.]|nr:hypothetical protein [Sphingobium sp.]